MTNTVSALYRSTGTTVYLHAHGCQALNRKSKFDTVWSGTEAGIRADAKEQEFTVSKCKCLRRY